MDILFRYVCYSQPPPTPPFIRVNMYKEPSSLFQIVTLLISIPTTESINQELMRQTTTTLKNQNTSLYPPIYSSPRNRLEAMPLSCRFISLHPIFMVPLTCAHTPAPKENKTKIHAKKETPTRGRREAKRFEMSPQHQRETQRYFSTPSITVPDGLPTLLLLRSRNSSHVYARVSPLSPSSSSPSSQQYRYSDLVLPYNSSHLPTA